MVMHRTCAAILALGFLASASARAETLERVISREHPSFAVIGAKMAVGRDGLVYLCTSGKDGYVLRIGRDGSHKSGGSVGSDVANATANADGIVASANMRFEHKLTLYDPNWDIIATFDDFLVNDRVGYAA